MNCKDIQRKLSAFLDRELSPRERARFEEHLAGCPSCTEDLRAFAHGDVLLKGQAAVEPSPFFETRLWQRIEDTKRAAERPAPFWERLARRWVPVPAVCAAFIFLFSGVSAFAPFLYGAGAEVKENAVQLAASTFTPAAAKKVFAPLNFVEFCNRCHCMLCKDCRAGVCTECHSCGGDHA